MSAQVQEPVLNTGVSGLMPVVRCEALTVSHVSPASVWTGNNESPELMGKSEDRAGTDDTSQLYPSIVEVPVYLRPQRRWWLCSFWFLFLGSSQLKGSWMEHNLKTNSVSALLEVGKMDKWDFRIEILAVQLPCRVRLEHKEQRIRFWWKVFLQDVFFCYGAGGDYKNFGEGLCCESESCFFFC